LFVAPIELPRFDWDISDHRKQFSKIVASLFNTASDRVEFPDPSASLAYMIHCATGGVIGDLLAIINNAVHIAADESRTRVEIQDLAKSYAQTIGDGNGGNPFEPGL
jgi:hypothetical protein